MPELPEVETIVRDLRPRLVGRRLLRVQVGRHRLRRKWSRTWTKQIAGRQVCAVARRGKWIVLNLDGPRLLVHLGMTGQFTVMAGDVPCAAHTHIVFALDDGRTELRFRDIRRFGSVSYLAGPAELERFFRESGLGPEPWDVKPKYWRGCLAKTSRCLKAVLLDQRVLAGVGNIYADEALFEARLHPALLGKHLLARQAGTLRRAVVTVLERAIGSRGSSIRDYVGGNGQKGNYQEEFRAYGRTGKPCLRCRKPIERIVLAGRATHFCPQCQKLSNWKGAVRETAKRASLLPD